MLSKTETMPLPESFTIKSSSTTIDRTEPADEYVAQHDNLLVVLVLDHRVRYGGHRRPSVRSRRQSDESWTRFWWWSGHQRQPQSIRNDDGIEGKPVLWQHTLHAPEYVVLQGMVVYISSVDLA